MTSVHNKAVMPPNDTPYPKCELAPLAGAGIEADAPGVTLDLLATTEALLVTVSAVLL
jgi:hypothetical protein